MAKIRSIMFGVGSSGSIGDITVRTSKGQVVASQKIAPTKGKLGTRTQVVNQARMANIIQAFRTLNACGNGRAMYQSFPGRDRKLSNANMFYRLNRANPLVSAVVQTKEMAERDTLIPAPFIVSRGSLAGLADMQALFSGTTGKLTISLASGQTAPTTIGALSTILLADYEGLRPYDTITIFAMAYGTGTAGVVNKIDAYQLIIDTASTDSLPSWITASSSTGIVFTLGTVEEGLGLDVAVVQGRNTAEGYQVSDADFTNNMLTESVYTSNTGHRAEEDAAQSYGYKDNPYLQAESVNPQE